MPLQSLLLLLLVCWRCSVDATSVNAFPSEVTVRAGMFHVPPYAYNFVLQENGTGHLLSADGFCPDMLDRLQIFAAQDNVTLNFELAVAPNTYDGALNLVANDCYDLHNKTDCDKFDVIAVDYYYSTERAMRIEYTPAWLHGAISAVKYVPNTAETNGADGDGENVLSTYIDSAGGTVSSNDEFVTMAQASREGYPVCVVEGTTILRITMEKFPGADFVPCPDQQACLNLLKFGKCRLYVDDRLQLRYRAVSDPTLVVSSETFNPQYILWVMNERTLDPLVLRLMKRWLIAAHQNGTFGELYEKYFEKEPCPIGRAGPNCEFHCDAEHGQANVHGVCVCKSPKWTGVDCSIPIPEELNMIPQSLKIMAYCLLGINAVLIAGCALWLALHWNSQQVRISQPDFLLLVLLGCAISSSTIIALAQEDSTSNHCMLIPWLYSVGFCVTFGTLFAKIRRVYIIFKSSAEMKRVTVTFVENLVVIGSVLFVDIIILVVWTFVDPLVWQRSVITADQFGEPLESVGYCTSEHWVAFGGVIAALHLVLLLTASCFCYISRHIPTKFSEGKYVSIAMVSNLQIFVVGVPVLIVVGSEPATSFFVRSVVIWMNDLVVVCLIFGNLIYSVSFSSDGHGGATVKDEIRSAMQEFSKYHDEAMDHSWHSQISNHSSGRISGKISNGRISPPPHSDIHLKVVNESWQASHVSSSMSSCGTRTGLELQESRGATDERSRVRTSSLSTIRNNAPALDFLEKDSWAQAMGESTNGIVVSKDSTQEPQSQLPACNESGSKGTDGLSCTNSSPQSKTMEMDDTSSVSASFHSESGDITKWKKGVLDVEEAV
ncbi:acid type B receptor subunit 2 [Seminavis robusta]|uniref:Acid type B receptor subunit 2 n=1 Tax=Seminavis robusta TaxID=568900 RepID=A0A9N8DNU1_9STRA|nr:acid type B receptor subunit 2 [Seminavis robusta]|eukprot:Sro186_g080670.1 acid type B receptor subunit 2 (832) ;mRNA; r:47964-50721